MMARVNSPKLKPDRLAQTASFLCRFLLQRGRVKASIVTNNRRAPGGLFVLHASSLPDNPYDGHTLRDVIDRTEALTGCSIERAYVDKGYRGHDAQNPRRVFISGQKRGVFGVIKRELRRRSAIAPEIGHMKNDGGRCYLKGRAGAAANVILSAVGHNFRRILAWLREFLALFLALLWRTLACPPRSIRLLNGRLKRSVIRRCCCHDFCGELVALD